MEDAVSFICGMFFGFFSGLFPGLHPNTVIAVLSSLGLDDRMLALMIISLYPAHLVSSFIPSIFFGIPDRATVMAVLPGQRMVLMGEGIVALKTVLLSCLFAALLSVALFYFSLGFFPPAYAAIRGNMGYVLLAVSALLLAKSRKPHLALLVFAVSGILGYTALGSGMYDPFLPLFSGMFAMAAIANYRKSAVCAQKDLPVGFGFMKFMAIGVLLGMTADLLPGIGAPSQIAAFATIFMPFDTVGYLAAVSSISVSQAVFSLATDASIGKSRVGATAWLSEAIDIGGNLPLLLAVFVASIALSALAVYLLRNRIASLAGLDFSKVNVIIAVYLAAITFVLDGGMGLVILGLGTALGWATIKMGVERTNLMGAIIVPTIMLLFRIFI
jgi:putative membrane protein